jgi:hypothetical protein
VAGCGEAAEGGEKLIEGVFVCQVALASENTECHCKSAGAAKTLLAIEAKANLPSTLSELYFARAPVPSTTLRSFPSSVRRFSMEMVASFAATALLLAGLGIYAALRAMRLDPITPLRMTSASKKVPAPLYTKVQA